MNKFFLIVLALSLAGPVRGKEWIYGVVARVNGEVISVSDVAELYGVRKTKIEENYSGKDADQKRREATKAALNELIDNALICEDFKARGGVIPEKLIDETVEKIVTEEFKGDKTAFIASLKEQGYTLDQFQDAERKNIMVQSLKQWVTEGSDGPAEKQKLLANYLAKLRKNAFIQILTEIK